jgi:hypothetical protein
MHISRRICQPFCQDNIMRHSKLAAAGSRLIPLTALLLATALGGCAGYTGYPSSNPAYNYSGGYYGGYPSSYNDSYNYRPL